MDLTRRRFAAGLAALSAGIAVRPVRARAVGNLVPGQARARLAPPGYPATPVWAYGGTVPGPEIRMPQGARLARRLVNRLTEPTTIHWHGIRLDNRMDGVPGLTQDPVAPGEAFLYDFELPDAGTYWYHPHLRGWEQVARGLYGALIVEEAGPPDTDRDIVLMIDDWRLTDRAAIAEDFGNLHDRAHAGRLGNWITVNGRGDWSLPVRPGERLRLRLVNSATARIFALETRGLVGAVVALDGQPLDRPAPLDRLTLAPAQRADLLADVAVSEGGEAQLVSLERDGGYVLVAFPAAGPARSARRSPPGALPPNPVAPVADLSGARRLRLVMEGGAMGRMTGARMHGRHHDLRGLAAAGMAWAMNGAAGMPEAPLAELPLGETVRLELVNDTVWPHAMHLHGHHFRSLPEGGPPGPLRDTVLVERGESREIGFVADNPGDWLLHCHMLDHSAAGMMTWIRVA